MSVCLPHFSIDFSAEYTYGSVMTQGVPKKLFEHDLRQKIFLKPLLRIGHIFVCPSQMFVCPSQMFVCLSQMFVCPSHMFVCPSNIQTNIILYQGYEGNLVKKQDEQTNRKSHYLGTFTPEGRAMAAVGGQFASIIKFHV